MEEHDRAAACARLWANTFVIQFHATCELYPDLVREALREVFDLGCLEARTQRAVDLCAGGHKYAQDVRHLVASVQKDIEELENRLDAIRYELQVLNVLTPEGAVQTARKP